ncbi:M23 family metallopeptidase [Solirubrobacter ginsenosidimutans]|uniref:M23 family metallopeptidase n=1 Tax=Solirubrobacter ginsenosidimutans TaxID=490573 RepID=A0A9X3MV79_9ACTN|nr:M23 family metallopeptidase [Solirubrobacter ginsenosidimutans]MDA0163339.1 M23 family metallopeptidase [Solirubrobacter ginsenosidimutans]
MRSLSVAFALLVWLVAPVTAQAWHRPVAGGIARPFAYARGTPFAAGAHRGVDLRARVGERVVAACAGSVVTAGPHVVTLRCGPWRVTALPLSSVLVRVGARVRAGAAVGHVGTLAGHTGLHFGVRRADDRFAYIDPAPLLREPGARPPVTAVPREGPREPVADRADPARPVAAPADAAPSHSAPRHSAAPGGVRVSVAGGGGALAPWPAWAGLVLLVLGAVGGGVKIGRRGRIAPLAEPVPEGVPSAP